MVLGWFSGGPVSLRNELRDAIIILIPLQFATFVVVASYLAYCGIELHRRNRRSWQTILARLSPAWIKQDQSLLSRNPKWLFRDAGVFMEIADYAERHGNGIPLDSIANLRNDALQIRMVALRTRVRRIYWRSR